MLLIKSFEDFGDVGDLIGVRHTFESIGDILPLHVHDDSTIHITIVAQGRVKIYSHDWSIEAKAGDFINFRPNEPHEFMALEDNTRIFNIRKRYGNISATEGSSEVQQ